MAGAVQRIGGMMDPAESPQVDRAYTVARIEWMLENYHALLGKKPKRPEDEDVKPGATSRHTQWWNAQAQWRQVDRKADLEAALQWATQEDYRKRVIVQYRWLNTPEHLMNWDEIAAMLALSRMHVWRLHRQIVADVAWWLGGVSDG